MGLSRHVYSGELWGVVSKKIEALGCDPPATGDDQATWLTKVDCALDKALELKRSVDLAVSASGVEAMNEILGPFGSPRVRQGLAEMLPEKKAKR